MTYPADPTPQASPADEAAAASSFDHTVTAPPTDTGAWADSLDGATHEPHVGVALADGTQENADSAPTAAPRRRRWPIAVGIGVVAAVVVATAGYAGARAWYGWGATEPEQVLPAGAAAFARIDLNPGYRDKLAVSAMLKKFPASKKAGASGAIDDLEASAVKGSGLNFADDVKPWFGDRAGVIAWPSDGATIPVLALASADDSKAKKALAKVKANNDHALGYTFLDGYVLVVPGSDGGQSAVDAVAAQAKAHPLADDPKYRAAVKSLPGNNLLIAYTDLAKAGSLAGSALGGDSALTGGLVQPDALKSLGLDKLTGTVIAGATVVATGVEVQVRGHGLPAATSAQAPVEVLADLGKLPADSLVAFAANGSPSSGAGSTGLLGGLLGGVLGGPSSALGGDPTADDGSDLGGDAALNAAMAASVQAMMTKITDGVQAIAQARLISGALTGLDSTGPNFVVKIETRDDAAAKAITGLGDVFDPMTGFKISSTGTQVEITSGTTGSGSLADSGLYRSAVAAQPGTTTAAYVDVQRLFAATHASATTVSQWAPVKAVGFTMGGSGSELTGTLRVVIK